VRRGPALLAVLALALAGCGGDGDSGSENDATALLKRAFATDVDTGVLTLDAELEPDGGGRIDGPLRLTLEGPFRGAGSATEMPDLDMEFRATGFGRTYTGRVTLTRENAWVEFEGTTYEVGEELWTRLQEALDSQSEGPETLGEAGIDPLDWLEGTETDGEEEVAGVPTTKVRTSIDLPRMLRDLNNLTDEPRAPFPFDVDEAVGDAQLDVWIGDDDIWRRISMETDFEVPEGRREPGGPTGGSLSFYLELEDPNEPVEIEGPAEARPVDELLRRFGVPPELLLGPGYEAPTPG
jgi:hypothetical protein